ncbi:NUDIX hydrolase domain protein [Kalmanozyma brasiliensis GHG001]|uniref:NUDIX hydrolase domain protein n=1 Tax=Kalmanozyma brasiliensis (strain GHG001) TaxID=1365824 RepID=UPI0028680330|nr:NUDIX hydrolase domain protein [Kalmanozyma brasiliensis GHG001]EST04533.2 NUDIX hydrolase domain protein [Kalmanozyma brasiliensis GHG001]
MSANGVANGDEPDWLHSLSPSNAACIRRLLALPSAPSFAHVPTRKQAAVAAILYESSSSELRVIMSTRALHLRSHPGQASLPGGKVDSSDRSVVETALRESVEEIALPARSAVHVHTGYPFLSKMGLLVHPVVFFLKNGEQILPKLRASPSEVADIWTTPLVAFLSSVAPKGAPLSDPSSVDKHRPPQEVFRTYTDIPWLGATYRLHRFRSSHQLIKGLTADVLISVAQKTFGEKARYKVEAEGQWSWERMVQLVVKRYTGERRPEQRWGDGESGDKQGSSEAFETFVGVDEEEEKEQDVSV